MVGNGRPTSLLVCAGRDHDPLCMPMLTTELPTKINTRQSCSVLPPGVWCGIVQAPPLRSAPIGKALRGRPRPRPRTTSSLSKPSMSPELPATAGTISSASRESKRVLSVLPNEAPVSMPQDDFWWSLRYRCFRLPLDVTGVGSLDLSQMHHEHKQSNDDQGHIQPRRQSVKDTSGLASCCASRTLIGKRMRRRGY